MSALEAAPAPDGRSCPGSSRMMRWSSSARLCSVPSAKLMRRTVNWRDQSQCRSACRPSEQRTVASNNSAIVISRLFAEAPWPAQEVVLALVDQLQDLRRLVDVLVAFLPDLGKGLDTDRQLLCGQGPSCRDSTCRQKSKGPQADGYQR